MITPIEEHTQLMPVLFSSMDYLKYTKDTPLDP